jgi:hypothetical protein
MFNVHCSKRLGLARRIARRTSACSTCMTAALAHSMQHCPTQRRAGARLSCPRPLTPSKRDVRSAVCACLWAGGKDAVAAMEPGGAARLARLLSEALPAARWRQHEALVAPWGGVDHLDALQVGAALSTRDQDACPNLARVCAVVAHAQRWRTCTLSEPSVEHDSVTARIIRDGPESCRPRLQAPPALALRARAGESTRSSVARLTTPTHRRGPTAALTAETGPCGLRCAAGAVQPRRDCGSAARRGGDGGADRGLHRGWAGVEAGGAGAAVSERCRACTPAAPLELAAAHDRSGAMCAVTNGAALVS